MAVEKLKLGSKDFEERKRVYMLLARVYTEGEKMGRPLTQKQLINIAYDLGYKLTEPTFIKYIKERKQNKH